MIVFDAILGLVYFVLLTFILIYSFVQINLVILYLRKRKKNAISIRKVAPYKEGDEVPFVTIQLPVFNELYVVERLIETVAKFNYPKDRFEIQVLDDSTDESIEVAIKKVAEIKALGINIEHIQRPDRVGYKAGALDYGTKIAKGDFIAIFDADFVPDSEFLSKTMPFFENPNVGVVQTKWEHLNMNYSLLTKLQSFALDAHFTIEQVGRNVGDHFINFNGTAGIWRKECIKDAGGWEHDTLTEDLDLSYRAQLKGWKFQYLEELGSPAELPAEMNALKAQQFRWTKGAAECAKKNLKKVMRAEGLALSTKVNAVFHLMNSFLFICIAVIGLLTYPLMLIMERYDKYQTLFNWFNIYYIGVVFLVIFYWVSYIRNKKNKFLSFFKFLVIFPVFLSVSMGLSLYNAIGVIEGYIGKKSAFVRTPKFNLKNNKDTWKGNIYNGKVHIVTIFEGIFALYFLASLLLTIGLEKYTQIPYFIMLTFGFSFVFFTSLMHSMRGGKA